MKLLKLDDVVASMAPIAETLAQVHARGYTHRDIKPDNIFRRNGRWEIGYFGLVAFPGKKALTQDRRKLGPAYNIAPEMLNAARSADGRPADVYSLAKTFWVGATRQAFPLPGHLDRRFEGARLGSYVMHATGLLPVRIVLCQTASSA